MLRNVSGWLRTQGRSSSPLRTLNTLTLSAMPTVSVATTVALLQGLRAISRKA